MAHVVHIRSPCYVQGYLICLGPGLSCQEHTALANILAYNQPLLMLTAFCHLSNLDSLSAFLIRGLKTVSPSVLISVISSILSQIPTAKPAAIAAPKAVVSRITGLWTGMPMMSAWVYLASQHLVDGEGESVKGNKYNQAPRWKVVLTCIVRSEVHMPPSTASSVRACLLSFSMASRIAFVWKQVASRVARAMWPCWVYAVIPNIVPRASSHQ